MAFGCRLWLLWLRLLVTALNSFASGGFAFLTTVALATVDILATALWLLLFVASSFYCRHSLFTVVLPFLTHPSDTSITIYYCQLLLLITIVVITIVVMLL
jgi:hypothetical protein